jgi:hypothetical protein
MDYTEYRYDYAKGQDFYFGLFSDLHLDSPKFAKEAFIKDANRAVAMGARLFFNGDVFDGMLPTDRKRYTRSSDGFDEDAQINARIDHAVKILLPYVNNIDFIGIGNHEASIVKYDHVDMVKLLVSELSKHRDQKLPPIQRGSYQGFIRLWFTRGGSATRQYVIYRDHGKGGASPVTKGTIPLNRIHTTFNADLYWLGHSHTDITDKGAWTIYPDNSGKIIKKRKRSVITAGYHEGFIQRNLGPDDCYRTDFIEEKFLAPTGLGSAILHITVPKSHDTTIVEAEVIS